MKRLVIVFLFAAVFLVAFSVSTYAFDNGDISEDIMEQQLNQLDTQKVEKIITDFNSRTESYIPKYTLSDFLSLIRNENGGYNIKALFKGIIKYFFKETAANSKLLGELIILAVVLAVLKNLQSAFERDTVGKLAYGVCYIVLIGITINSFSIALDVGKNAINDMVSFMQAILPMLLSILVSLGGVTTAAVFHPVILMALSAVSTLIRDILLPVVFFSAILCIINNVSPSIQVSRLAGLLKESCIAILGFFLSIFLGVLIVQGAGAAVADGVTIRTAKFATKNFIPIVGGIFSDALDTVVGCSLLIKNAIGVMGVIVIFIIVVFPVIKILSIMFIYKLAGAIIEPLGDSRLVKCLNDLGGSLILIFVSIASVAIMFFISVTIIIGAGNLTVMLR